jgi:hypothetical protein
MTTPKALLTVPPKQVLKAGAIDRLIDSVEATLNELDGPLSPHSLLLDAANSFSLLNTGSIRQRHERCLHAVTATLRFSLAAALLQQEPAGISRWLTLWERIEPEITREYVDEIAPCVQVWISLLPEVPLAILAQLVQASQHAIRAVALAFLRPELPHERALMETLREDKHLPQRLTVHLALCAYDGRAPWLALLPQPLPPHIDLAAITSDTQETLLALGEIAQQCRFGFPPDRKDPSTNEAVRALLAKLPSPVALEVSLTFLQDAHMSYREKDYAVFLDVIAQGPQTPQRLAPLLVLWLRDDDLLLSKRLQALEPIASHFTPEARVVFAATLTAHFSTDAIQRRQDQPLRDYIVSSFCRFVEKIWPESAPCAPLLRACLDLPHQTKDDAEWRSYWIDGALSWVLKQLPEQRDMSLLFTCWVEAVVAPGRTHWRISNHLHKLLDVETQRSFLASPWPREALSAKRHKRRFYEWVFPSAEGSVEERLHRFLSDPSTRALMCESANKVGAVDLLHQAASQGLLTPAEQVAATVQAALYLRISYFFHEFMLNIHRAKIYSKRKQKTADAPLAPTDPKTPPHPWWVLEHDEEITDEERNLVRSARGMLDQSADDYWEIALSLIPKGDQDASDITLLDAALAVWRQEPQRVPILELVGAVLGARGPQALVQDLERVVTSALALDHADDTISLLQICFLTAPRLMVAQYFSEVPMSTIPEWVDIPNKFDF